jgi:hypothetical protein
LIDGSIFLGEQMASLVCAFLMFLFPFVVMEISGANSTVIEPIEY